MANRAKSNPKAGTAAKDSQSQEMRRIRRNQVIFAVISLIMIISMLISLVKF